MAVRGVNKGGRLILFDLDGTLVDVFECHIAGTRAALGAVYGIDEFAMSPTFTGRPITSVIRMAGQVSGLSPEVIEHRLTEALRVKTETTIAALGNDLRSAILQGAMHLLDALKQRGHGLALVTGTVQKAARIILRRTHLDRHFPVCAFGDEAEERLDLVRLVLDRAAKTYDLRPGTTELVVVGDAPVDIQVGQEIGARTVAVATGMHELDDLARYCPDVLLPDLQDWPAALQAIEE
ncbi:MAG: HAD family hydrolase [Anaerolineales bacterium]|nr:MAG: HAD family hydrolase [Anaerolineales bacterium]